LNAIWNAMWNWPADRRKLPVLLARAGEGLVYGGAAGVGSNQRRLGRTAGRRGVLPPGRHAWK
jgi:hypothetical protein